MRTYDPRPATLISRMSILDDAAVSVVGSVAAGAALVAFFEVARRVGPDGWVPMVVLMVLVAASVPIICATAGRPMDRRLRRILVVAFALKMLCTFPRYLMNEVAYGGSADARTYHDGGTAFRQNVSEGRWTLDGTFMTSLSDETEFVGYVVGALYLLIGASQMGGYLVFTWVGWLGLICVFRAFRVSFPNAPPYLAAMLIFFLPSTLYWPSSLGKDALMLFGIGLITLGVARIMAGASAARGVAWLTIGGALILEIRPHLLLIALVGAAVSLVARNRSADSRGRSVLGRVLLLVALVPALFFGLARMDQMFGSTKDAGAFTVTAALARTAGQTAVGGSTFETQPVHSPVDLPVAVANVLYRPFPFEARTIPAMVTALEGTVLLALTVAAGRWVWRMGPAMWQWPIAAFCGGFVLAFVFAFSNVANAGILARQRVQMFPVLMLLVAAAAEHRRLAAEGEAPADVLDLDARSVACLDQEVMVP